MNFRGAAFGSFVGRNKAIRPRTVLSFLVLAPVFCLTSPCRAEFFAWVQLGEGHKVVARAIVENGTCPLLSADGKPLEMTVRAHPEAHIVDVPPNADFSKATVCEAEIRSGTNTLLAGETVLPLPRSEVSRIVVLGDSGCRIKQTKNDFELQDCRDEDAWPYAKVVKQAAAARPDLVIHVGDYAYRESACPSTRNCAGPWGYGYDSWKADFFQPSQPLFQTAPWIMVRGNHEDCDRAGEGWLRFLDRGALPGKCEDLTGFFVVRHANLNFVVMDNARAAQPRGDRDGAKRKERVNRLREQFLKIADDIPREPTWLLSHRPFFGLHYGPDIGYRSDNDMQYEATKEKLSDTIWTIISGHIHAFEALSFGTAAPPQLVVGTAGDNLEEIPPQQVKNASIGGLTVDEGIAFSRFGYLLLDKRMDVWKGTFIDPDGRPLASCELSGRKLSCKGHREGE